MWGLFTASTPLGRYLEPPPALMCLCGYWDCPPRFNLRRDATSGLPSSFFWFSAPAGADRWPNRPKAGVNRTQSGVNMRTTQLGPPGEVSYTQKLLIAVKVWTFPPSPEGGGRCRGKNDSFFLPLGSPVSAPSCINSPGTGYCLCCWDRRYMPSA